MESTQLLISHDQCCRACAEIFRLPRSPRNMKSREVIMRMRLVARMNRGRARRSPSLIIRRSLKKRRSMILIPRPINLSPKKRRRRVVARKNKRRPPALRNLRPIQGRKLTRKLMKKRVIRRLIPKRRLQRLKKRRRYLKKVPGGAPELLRRGTLQLRRWTLMRMRKTRHRERRRPRKPSLK